MKLDDAITKGDPFPVKALWIASENFLNQMPGMNRIINDLLPCLDLIVVVDLAMTVTAKYADYVLPEASFYEYVDLLDSYPVYTPYLQLQQKVIEPLYESKSDFQIAAELGRRMGFGEYFNKTEEQYLEDFLASDHPSMEGVNLERLKEGPIRAKPSEKMQELKTPTGRIEFYVEKLKPFGQELPVYMEPLEGARSEKAKTYPLSFITSHPKYRKSSAMGNVEALTKHDPEPFLNINPKDAAPRNITNKDVVLVFNDRGKVKLKAKLNPNIKPGVVDIQQGWWPEHYLEGHHNQLTHGIINPAQAAIFQPNAALFDVLVEVKKA
jgi:molybdopterin-containing oxidoreductase family molybdopterin binding subunit